MSIDFNNLFLYSDGKLYWKVSSSRKIKIGAEAGTTTSKGYIHIKYKGKLYYAHRIIYEMYYGKIPEGLYIDHINRIRDDNRLENLRLVTNQENHFNKGAKGYYFHKPSGKYLAQIRLNGNQKNLGYYNTKEEAREAYLEAKEELHMQRI